MSVDFIHIKGGREHNLKNIDLEIPRNQLVVITGLSGSGKSSLAFDTIYAEGQRRYIESLSAYARQFLEMMQKPDIDFIEGLSPAIAIEQKTTSRNPRSNVGTVTEIYDYLRLLYARIGVPYSPVTGKPIESQTATQMVDAVLQNREGARFYLLAPVVRGRKGEYKKELLGYRKMGYQRFKIDGNIYEANELPELDKKYKHDIDIVVDRIAVRKDLRARLADSIETALKLSDGLFILESYEDAERQLFSEKFACPYSGFSLPRIEPRLFSFNNPMGACEECGGLGEARVIAAELVVADSKLSLQEGALAPWAKREAPYFRQTLQSIAAHFGASLNTPFEDLSDKMRYCLLYGSDEIIKFNFDDGLRTRIIERAFEGVIPNLQRRYRESESGWVREEIGKYQIATDCPQCQGYRLKPEALSVRVGGKHIGEVSALSIAAAQTWGQNLQSQLRGNEATIAERILKEINERLGFLLNVGLQYLTLSRPAATLSGGESQRIRLASQIGSGLTGVLYVLDEPSIGLHQSDNSKLLDTLKHLRDLGNTVIVVEHDEEAMRAADYLVDMGPGAGLQGGHVVAAGTPQKVFANPHSLTAQYISGHKSIDIPKTRRKPKHKLTLCGASGNNLQNVKIDIPLSCFVCVTGVSGSGKSTLIIETLYKALSHKLMHSHAKAFAYEALWGSEFLDKVIDIDQSPIGRTSRSNPATYTGAFTPIREWFAALPDAKARGFNAGRFSFNVKGGRCETCQGDGEIKIEMHFLPDVHVVCEQCKGRRYNRETLAVQYKGKSIYDVLAMSVAEALDFFAAVPGIRDKMEMLCQVGLGYIAVGQSATTLSGGEAQRVKLAKELSRRATGRTLYILDEPTTGLHFEDIRKLLNVLQALVKQGNTVLVIEHNLEVIKTADMVIDMGPGGGDEGGHVLAIGTPEQIAKHKHSHTGAYLKPLLQRQKTLSKASP